MDRHFVVRVLAGSALTFSPGLPIDHSLTRHAAAAPMGPSYDHRQVTITTSGKQTIVNQSSPQATITWNSFNVGPGESVQFNQPGRQSVTLNRVRSGGASLIEGSITANGQIIIENSNGVKFTETARVDVGSLVATSLRMRMDNIEAGRLIFDGTDNPNSRVENRGTISVSDRGLAALVAPSVANSGTITAKTGTVALVAGHAATVDFYGDGLVSVAVTAPVTRKPIGTDALVTQAGAIRADGGTVVLTAEAASGIMNSAINMSGLTQARGVSSSGGKVALVSTTGSVAVSGVIDVSSSVPGQSGGAVHVLGHEIEVDGKARIEASGVSGGGTVLVGGDLHGRERGGEIGYAAGAGGTTRINTMPEELGSGRMPRASRTKVARGARVNAAATRTGDGGTVVAWSDGILEFDGTVDAGAASGGRGGMVETSARGRLAIGANARVSPGNGGAWLVDPVSIAIVASGGSAASVGAANSATGAATIDVAAVVAALGSGAVILQATDEIDVQAAIAPTSLGGSPAGLQLIATGSTGRVSVDAPILLPNGNLVMRAPAAIDLSPNARIDTGRGTVWLETGATGRLLQMPGSSIVADAIAAIAGDVVLTSFDNNAGTIAGRAITGGFQFNQTNETGVTKIGTVADPFSGDRVGGVIATSVPFKGSQPFDASRADGTATVTFDAGGAAFDTLVFTALPYGILPTTPPVLPFRDSSDYFINQISFTSLDTGRSWTVRPTTASHLKPGTFGVKAPIGSVTVAKNRWGVAGFTAPGPDDLNELQLSSLDGSTELLRFTLGTRTTSATVTFSQFFNPEPRQPAVERGLVSLVDSIGGEPVIRTRLFAPAPPAPVALPPGSVALSPGPVATLPALVAGVTSEATEGLVQIPTPGRDPDTPGDAVYRTSPYENPYIEDPYNRSYALGTYRPPLEGLSRETLAQIAPAAGTPAERSSLTGASDNDRTGQHALRGATTPIDLPAVNLGTDEQTAAAIADALAQVVPEAGPGATPTGSRCGVAGFMADFWNCTPAPATAIPPPR